MDKRTLLLVGLSMAMLGPACANAGIQSASGTPSPSPSPALEDGRHFGYIKSAQLTAQPQFIVFDLAYLLTGDEANQAAADRGLETPVPNDYFIVNDNPRLRALPPAPALLFQESFDQKKYPPGNYKGKFSGYWLTVKGGAVTKVEEQYFP